MRICIAILCLLTVSARAQESTDDGYLSFYLRYDEGKTKLSEYEESLLLDHVYDLFYSESVIIKIRRNSNSFADEAITSERYDYFVELRKEYGLSEATTAIEIVSSRFEEDVLADVHIRFRDPILQKKLARKETKFTQPDGWRAHCFASDVSFVRNTKIQILHTPEEFENIHLLTVDEDGERLEVFAVVSITFPKDTVFPAPVKFQIPLHGIEEIGCKEYMLMSGASSTFPANSNKASVKREDGMMLWKLDADKSGTYVIARKAADTHAMKFCAPEGYVLVSGRATSMSPYLQVEATVAGNQLSATFNRMPDPEHVMCDFVIADLAGNQYSTPAVSAKSLMNGNMLSFLRKGDPVLPEMLVAQKVLNN